MENEEIKKESVDAVVIELMSRELNKYLGKTQEYFEGVAHDLMQENPEKTPEQLGDIYEEMCAEAEKNKTAVSKAPEMKDDEDSRE